MAQRYDILQSNWDKSCKTVRPLDRTLIWGLIERLNTAGIDWRGGREVYIGELV